MKPALRTFIIVMILGTTIGCDQVSKKIARNQIGKSEKISVIHPYVTLMRVENTGAFMSAGNSLPLPARFVIFIFLPIGVMGYAAYYLFSRRSLPWSTTGGICLIVGGGVGNIIDRLVRGSVTDFMHIDFVLFQTGIFNVADMAIMAGVGIMFFTTLSRKPPENMQSAAKDLPA